jgi:hypothetical protein
VTLNQTSSPSDLADIFSGNPSVVPPPGIDENFKTAYINQWSFGVQRELDESLVLDVSYVGTGAQRQIQFALKYLF